MSNWVMDGDIVGTLTISHQTWIYHGYICLSIMIDNTNWSGYYENDSNSQYYPNSRYTVPYAFTYLGQVHRINVQGPR